MVRKRFHHLVLACLTSLPLAAEPVLNEAGDLQATLEGMSIPAAEGDDYALPDENELAAFRAALRHILDGDLQSAADEAVNANYDVVSYTDNVTADVFAMLREKNSNQHWGGTYVIDLTPERELVVESPHPLYDGVRIAAIDIFMDTGAVAFLQAGTHRNNSTTESDCDGDLGGEAYRISDMAHAPGSLFQAAHEVIEAHFDRTVSLSFHGMADDSDPADVVVSNGTSREFWGNSLSRDLATRMNEIILANDANDTRYAVSHQEPGENPALSGSTNTQGRATNGSPDLCMADAPAAIFPERFIHMECAPNVREGDPSNWSFVIQTLNERIPLFADPDPDLPTGDIVITEIMPNPQQVGEGTGEYIELFNHTGFPITMTDWSLVDRQLNRATFSGVIQPGDLFVVGVNSDLNGGGQPGGVPDAVWTDVDGDMTLTNTGDTIILFDDNDDPVASVVYGDVDDDDGMALEILVANQHPNGQTIQASYAFSATPFGADLGSPGTRGDSQFPLPDPGTAVEIDGSDLSIAFTAARAVTYTLWDSPDLDDWDETPGETPVVGDGIDAAFELTLPLDPARFYRLVHDYAAPE